jgi:hypothetical protein
MEINIIDNIIVNHTKHDVESYTGASLQSLLTHKTTKLSFKLTLFFGYNASKNSVSETIEITQTQYERLSEAVIEKNLSVLSNCNSVLTDDCLFGKSSTASLRLRDDPTNTNTITITTNTITTNTNTKKDQIENFIPNEASLKAVRDKYTGITQSQGAELIQSFKDQMFNRTAKWQDLQSCFRNYLRKDYIQVGVASAKKGTFAGMSDSRKALIAMKLQDKVAQ